MIRYVTWYMKINIYIDTNIETGLEHVSKRHYHGRGHSTLTIVVVNVLWTWFLEMLVARCAIIILISTDLFSWYNSRKSLRDAQFMICFHSKSCQLYVIYNIYQFNIYLYVISINISMNNTWMMLICKIYMLPMNPDNIALARVIIVIVINLRWSFVYSI